MGNNTAGQSMAAAAEEAVRSRPQRSDVTALALLDKICEPYRGSDPNFAAVDPKRPGRTHPDFPDYRRPHRGAALGMLMLEAFAPNGLADFKKYQLRADFSERDEMAADAWWDDVGKPFRARYDFH